MSAAGVIEADFPGGMRPDDSHEVSQLNELKIDVSALCVGAHYALAGVNVMVEQMPIYGGYAGGLEETTIVDVATTLNSFVMMQGTWHLDGPVHVRWGITTSREVLAVAAHACRAIEEHTHLMLGNQYYTLAGPCTVMCLLETAAQAITDTCSGREILSGVASCKGVTTDLFTAMEARMMGEAAHAVAGMDTHEVNLLLDKLIGLYEKDYKTAPTGKKFQECYDVKTLTPSDEYVKVYDEAVKVLTDLGLTYWDK
ncbi:MAG: monomethylamine:corrinoid methyltransferase [Lachnospiraceae bacterium]|nr:monomethylamine:corrinoid methyltransferase [Lachnospiraceae bacterium]